MVDARTDTLGALLRGELAAVETYQQAIDKLAGGPGTAELRQILMDHREAAIDLRQHIQLAGGAAEDSSGVWGAFAKAAEGLASLLGNATALAALRQGEERGALAYENALADEELSPAGRTLIRSQLLPRTQAHLSMLDWLISKD